MSRNCPLCGTKVHPTATQLKYKNFRCLPCRRAIKRRWRIENKEHVVKYNQKLWSSPEYRESERVRQREYRKNNPTVHARARNRYPEKLRARQEFNRAVRAGKIRVPTNCSKCGVYKPERQGGGSALHGHHYLGYKFPLKVKWLCSVCHFREHQHV